MARGDNERGTGGPQDRATRVRNKMREARGETSLVERGLEILTSPAGRLWGLDLAFALIISLLLLYPEAITPTAPSYAVGDIAREAIYAPKDFPVVDKTATKVKQDEAVAAVLAVYDFDTTEQAETIATLSSVFTQFRNLYSSLEMQGLLAPRNGRRTELISPRELGQAGRGIATQLSREEYDLIVKDTREKEAAYRAALGIPLSDSAFHALKADRFTVATETAIAALITPLFNAGIVSSPELLKPEVGRGITIRHLPLPPTPVATPGEPAPAPPPAQEDERKDLSAIKGLDEVRAAVAKSADRGLKDMPDGLRRAVVETSQGLLQVNLTFNKSETEARKAAATENTNAIFFQVKKGEAILREGDKINETALDKIQAMGQAVQGPKSGLVIVGTLILVALGLAVIYTFSVRGIRKFKPSFADLCVMVGTAVVLMAGVKAALVATSPEADIGDTGVSYWVYVIPVAAGPMLIRLLINYESAVVFTLLFAPLMGVLAGENAFIAIYVAISGILGAGQVGQCKQRTTLLRAGLSVGVANVIMLMAHALITDTFIPMNSGTIWATVCGMGAGLLAGILVLAFAPLLESSLGYTTDIKLLELSSHENTLLKELIYRAPGTYQHSIMVGTLAEAAAEAIHVNPLLARVMALYHDVGKMINPLYFAENQREGKNPHHKLAPSLSSRVITAHVKDGVELARQHKLPEIVIEGIPGHHGTRLIKYFYEKAVQAGEPTTDSDFRYPGPKPHSREAGIMMLADSVEAASRSLKDPTPARIRQVVQTMVNTIFADGQLDECELTLRDLHNISEAFFRVLGNVYHSRPEYPGTPFASDAAQKEFRKDKTPPGEDSDESRRPPPAPIPFPAGGHGIRPEEPPGLFQDSLAGDGPDDAESPRIWKH